MEIKVNIEIFLCWNLLS